MPMRNTIVVPCIVNSWLYAAAESNVPSGRASCRRISSASMPPARKNTIAVVPYMMAIFLWSGVVNQLHTPVVARGRSSSRVAARNRQFGRRHAAWPRIEYSIFSRAGGRARPAISRPSR